MVIAIYQMARWHDGTKGVRVGKFMPEYCNLPRSIVFSMRLQYSRRQRARPGDFSPSWLANLNFNISKVF